MTARATLEQLAERLRRDWQDEVGRQFLHDHMQPLIDLADAIAAVEDAFDAAVPNRSWRGR